MENKGLDYNWQYLELVFNVVYVHMLLTQYGLTYRLTEDETLSLFLSNPDEIIVPIDFEKWKITS